MKPNFITPVSMECTQEQYEKDLNKQLKVLGYQRNRIDRADNRDFICTNSYGAFGWVEKDSGYYDQSYFIDHYNPELFLALAAMTKGHKPIVGEWMYLLERDLGEVGTLFQVKRIKFSDWESGGINPYFIGEYYRKATKKEIIEYFTNQKKQEVMDFVTFTPEQQREVYNMACSTWKPKIKEVFADSLFEDKSFNLPITTFEEWLKESTTEQKDKFKQMQPDYFKQTKKTYQQGMRFKGVSGSKYILAQIAVDTMVLIDLDYGNRFTNPVFVSNPMEITQTEFDKITGNQSEKFILID